MFTPKYTDQQIRDLRVALAKDNVVLPEDIEKIASGSFGVCFIGKNTVLKLYQRDHLRRIAKTDVYEPYFDRSIQAYQNLSMVAKEITRRGLIVPKLLAWGKFETPIRVGHQTYFAYQIMTRMDGISQNPSDRPQFHPDLHAERKNILEGIKIATKIHLQVDPADKDIIESTNIHDFYGLEFIKRRFNLDGKTHKLLDVLEKDIKSCAKQTTTVTFLHGDLHDVNVLKNDAGQYSVIDWDQQKFGRAERDVYGMFMLHPKNIKKYCDRYNAVAEHPVDEKLIVAYGMIATLNAYLIQIAPNNKAFYSKIKRDRITDMLGTRMSELASRMYDLTGKKIYAEAAQHFLNPHNLIGGPGIRHYRAKTDSQLRC